MIVFLFGLGYGLRLGLGLGLGLGLRLMLVLIIGGIVAGANVIHLIGNILLSLLLIYTRDHRQRARRALMLSNNVPLRTRRVLLP